MNANSPSFQQAVQAYQHGQQQRALQLCESILKSQPRHADTLHLSGILLAQQKQWSEAEIRVQKAIKAQRKTAVFHNTLGNILQQQQQWEAAKTSYQQALRLSPKLFDAQHNLGEMFRKLGDIPKAEQCFRKALKINSDYPDALNGLGGVYRDTGQTEKALRHYQKLVQHHPHFIAGHYNLGLLYQEQEHWTQALECFEHTFKLNPDHADAYVHASEVCLALKKLDLTMNYLQIVTKLQPKRFDRQFKLAQFFEAHNFIPEAIERYHIALQLEPEDATAWNNLGSIYHTKGQLKKALSCFQRALDYVGALSDSTLNFMIYNNIGNSELARGDIKTALQAYKKALEFKPHSVTVHSNLLLALHYSDTSSRTHIFSYTQSFQKHCVSSISPLSHSSHTFHQPLRIAYLSEDFRSHSVAYFMEGILKHHHHPQFETFIYMYSLFEDSTSEHLKKYVPHWLNCAHWSDEQLMQQIQADEIDILVDLGGHTGNNKLTLLAHKPAPIQMSYLGYPDTTGLSSIDYRIADRYTEPEEAQAYSSETLLRMPHSYFCYTPAPQALDLAVGEAPCLKNTYITFGSFNNYQKINDFTLSLWADVLHAVPHSRLFLKTKSFNDEETQQACLARFQACGIAAERIMMVPFADSLVEHLTLYQQVDMCLDTYPYQGATTTCEALWMGVPVLSLQGSTHVARVGQSLLSTIGLAEWAVETRETFIEKARFYANDLLSLEALRQSIRERLQHSPLMQAQAFTRDLEALYIQVVNTAVQQQEGAENQQF